MQKPRKYANQEQAMYGLEPVLPANPSMMDVIHALNWYAAVTNEDTRTQWIVDWSKKRMSAHAHHMLQKYAGRYMNPTWAHVARMTDHSPTLPASYADRVMPAVEDFMKECERRERQTKADPLVAARQVASATRQRENAAAVAELEAIAESILDGHKPDKVEFTNKAALDEINRQAMEWREVLNDPNDDQLAEAYADVPKSRLRAVVKWVDSLSTVVIRARKMRAPRKLVPAKIVKHVIVAATSRIKPEQIIGGKTLWMYHTKTHDLIRVIGEDCGLSVKGTRLINVASAVRRKLRKPEAILNIIHRNGMKSIEDTFAHIRTKEQVASTLLGKQLELVRVF